MFSDQSRPLASASARSAVKDASQIPFSLPPSIGAPSSFHVGAAPVSQLETLK
jgi:hypothetical protein